jgi:hypothetical protein
MAAKILASRATKIKANIKIGQKFDMLTIISKPDPKKVIRGNSEYQYSNETLWIAKCECGKVVETRTKDLIKNKRSSCGCAKNTKNRIKIGDKFRNLTVVSNPFINKGRNNVHCICSCGRYTICTTSDLLSRKKTCGQCVWKMEYPKGVHHSQTHGMSKSSEYCSWIAMKDRCKNPENLSYADYGERGIEVCERWEKSFEKFYEDMGPRPRGMSLDRWPDMNGNYEPSNCRWATDKQQSRNRRNVKFYEFQGKMMSCPEIAEILGMSPSYIWSKMRKEGMTAQKIADSRREPYQNRQKKRNLHVNDVKE